MNRKRIILLIISICTLLSISLIGKYISNNESCRLCNIEQIRNDSGFFIICLNDGDLVEMDFLNDGSYSENTPETKLVKKHLCDAMGVIVIKDITSKKIEIMIKGKEFHESIKEIKVCANCKNKYGLNSVNPAMAIIVFPESYTTIESTNMPQTINYKDYIIHIESF